jgi:hypothetical protein
MTLCACGQELTSTGGELPAQEIRRYDVRTAEYIVIYSVCSHGIITIDKRAEFGIHDTTEVKDA